MTTTTTTKMKMRAMSEGRRRKRSVAWENWGVVLTAPEPLSCCCESVSVRRVGKLDFPPHCPFASSKLYLTVATRSMSRWRCCLVPLHSTTEDSAR